ncbi:hypothetical protein Scep_010024 [Stephania cephalantha]|uniref:Uncharacterized protein n=1 Tax=Stephania cephalantha TaxID=152367 RepID=A0AAP0JVM0_9MAGN
METDGKARGDCEVDPSGELELDKFNPCLNGAEEECSSLLSPRRCGMSEKPKRSRRKVQWNDKNGDKLVEVLEFQPSDSSDSDEEDSDSCICTVM